MEKSRVTRATIPATHAPGVRGVVRLCYKSRLSSYQERRGRGEEEERKRRRTGEEETKERKRRGRGEGEERKRRGRGEEEKRRGREGERKRSGRGRREVARKRTAGVLRHAIPVARLRMRNSAQRERFDTDHPRRGFKARLEMRIICIYAVCQYFL